MLLIWGKEGSRIDEEENATGSGGGKGGRVYYLLSLPGLVPVRPIRQSRLGRKTSGNWSPQMELKYMHLNEGAIGGILRGGDGQDGKIRGVGVGV
jgi:hypothetical protein